MQEWKDVAGYEGVYQVSSFGNVRSRTKSRLYFRKLRPSFLGKGYLGVTLYKNGKRKKRYVHRLVAETFIPNPLNLSDVNHKDRVKTNNTISNLEWKTSQENTLYNKKIKKPSRLEKKRKYILSKPRSTKGEKWKEMFGYEGFYLVSSFGRVFRRPYLDGKNIIKSGYIVSLSKRREGYLGIRLRIRSEMKHKFVHRLVMETFLGINKLKPFVNHKDGVKTNNNLENLEWCTHAENIRHAVALGLISYRSGSENRNAKLSKEKREELKRMASE